MEGSDVSQDETVRRRPRVGTNATHATQNVIEPTISNLRRRSTMATRRSDALGRTWTGPSHSQFTMAGPDEGPVMRAANEPYVQPGYADLNPAYEQPANAKPVWSLSKPLPRVVRPGMIPTKSEIIQARTNPELPAENSHNAGVDVDPNDLEKGKVQPTLNPAKISAQLKDSRAQRENNFVSNLVRSGTTSRIASNRLSRVGSWTPSSQTSQKRRRASTWAAEPDIGSPIAEQDFDPGAFVGPFSVEARRRQTSTKIHENSQHVAALTPINERPEFFDGPADLEDDESVTTLGVDEEEYSLDLEPLVHDFIEDEIHNNHTAWSVLRTKYREPLAELLAVIVQLTIGFSADLSVTVANAGNPNTTDWAWGFATMIAIYISGGISGAHLNPTITTMLWMFRGFPKRKMPGYFLAQFLGAFIAAFIAYGLYYVSIQEYLIKNTASGVVNSFVTNQRYTYIDKVTAFFNEFVGTAVLVITILALGDNQNAPPGVGMASFVIGLVITALSLAFANQTGAALNPSRDFGPRLALFVMGYGGELFANPYWFYGPFAATLLGGVVGASLYDIAIFTGGESPINYPWAMRKEKWAARLRLKPKESEDQAAVP